MQKTKANKHRVKANMQVLELTKNGSSVEFEIFDGNTKLGEILLGQGSFQWKGANKQKSKRYSWSYFVKIMNALAYEGGKVCQ